MSRERKPAPVLADEHNALSVYFEALLREIPEPVEVEPAPAPPAPAPVVQPQVVPAPAKAPAPSEMPAWGQQRFQAMLFRVAGLTLAVPLVELSGVQEWDPERITPMPNHVPWYLGLMLYRERNAPVVDTARLVLPEDRLARLSEPGERLQRVVFIDDGRWGLACDEVAEVITLGTDQVRWRTHRTTRAWLAGTVIEHMCALIDPPAFARMLATGVVDAGIEPDAEQL